MKVAIYARVSTEKQEEQDTVDSQLAALREFAKSNNYTVVEEYIDEGWSGTLLERPAIDKLRDDAREHKFETVLINDVDRFARDMLCFEILKRDLEKNGVRIIFRNLPINNTIFDDYLPKQLALIGELERIIFLDRTRRGRKYKAEQGFVVGGIAPYGYKYIKKDREKNIFGHYEILDDEANIVKLIFDLFINKRLSIRAIARELTSRGIPPRQGKHWRTSSLHRIIRNETYAGVTYYNKHYSVEPNNHKNGDKYRRAKNTGRRLRTKDKWVPIVLPEKLIIIDRKTFESAREQLKRNSALSPRNTKYHYLLRGLVKCGKCDSPFYGTPCHGELFYRCGNRNRTFPLPKECNVPMVKARSLEDIVWDKFCEAIKNPRLITTQIIKLREKEKSDKNNIEKDIEVVDRQLKKIEYEESRLLDAFTENIISKEQFKTKMDGIRDKKLLLEKDKQKLSAKKDDNVSPIMAKKSIRDYCRQLEVRLNNLNSNFEGKQYLLSLSVNRIMLEDKKIRIKGVIPYHCQVETNIKDIASTPSQDYKHNMSSVCDTKSTTSGYYAHRLPLLPGLF